MALPPRRAPSAPALRRLGNELLEAPDLDGLARLLTLVLPEVLGLPEVTLLLWDRKLDRFEEVSTHGAGRKAVRAGEGTAAPQARYLLSDGDLIETQASGDDGILVPLMARSGLVGMLVLASGAPRRRTRTRPLRAGESRLVSDLAARAALALENHLYQQELIASERMAALGTMAGMLAHDFRGPMTIIRGYAELLLMGQPTPEVVRARATHIMAMVDRLENMTRETLDFARGGGRLARRRIDAREFLEDVAAGLSEELPTLEVCCVTDGLPPDLVAALDVDKLRRAIGNLAANARDAMGGAGRLHLAAVVTQRADGSDCLELLVRDEGPGIPDEVRERLFEPFVTHGKAGGTGLGLAVARRFVEDHGGSLELLEGGPGARFRIQLPLQPLPQAVPA